MRYEACTRDRPGTQGLFELSEGSSNGLAAPTFTRQKLGMVPQRLFPNLIVPWLPGASHPERNLKVGWIEARDFPVDDGLDLQGDGVHQDVLLPEVAVAVIEGGLVVDRDPPLGLVALITIRDAIRRDHYTLERRRLIRPERPQFWEDRGIDKPLGVGHRLSFVARPNIS